MILLLRLEDLDSFSKENDSKMEFQLRFLKRIERFLLKVFLRMNYLVDEVLWVNLQVILDWWWR